VIRGLSLALCALALLGSWPLRTARGEQDRYVTANLVPNGDFERDADGDGWPDGWPRVNNAAWKEKGGNHYLSLRPGGGPTFDIPLRPDWTWVRVSCRMRCNGIVLGPHPDGYQDARVVMSWQNADHKHIPPWPDVLHGVGTFDWKRMERRFKIPAGAKFLSIGPVNYAAKGTVDYDDIVIRGERRPPLEDLPLPAPEETVWDTSKAWRLESATRAEVCLNGLYQFRPVQTDEELKAPPRGPGWGYFKVPASWRDSSVTVHLPEAVSDADMNAVKAAWYRRRFHVPASWDGRKLELRFDLVQTRASVFIDGKHAGDVTWPGGTVDVTPLCKPGSSHTLEVLVFAVPMNPKTQVFSAPDRVTEITETVSVRGLCGDVFLLGSPQTGGIDGVFVQPSVQQKRITLDVSVRLPGEGPYRLRASIEHGGKEVKRFESAPFGPGDLKDGHFAFGSAWADPPLWDVDDPQFCTVRLSLVDEGGKVLDEALPVRFGFRDFVIKGRDFYLNGKRIHLRALTLSSATSADTGSLEGARNTFRRMKAYGFNFCIMNNYHFRAGAVNYFMDMIRAADEEGMLMSFSLPHMSDFRYSLQNPQMAASYRAVAGWCVRQVRHHPAVVMYAMNHNSTGYRGDQNPALLDGMHGPDTYNRRQALIAQGIAESLDPTRPVYHHESGNLGNMITLNCYLNWAPIQERSRWLAHWARAGVKPLFFVEWGLPHIASWSSYRGPKFIWRSYVMQQAWTHEFAATFKGDAAYTMDQSDIDCLKTELKFWRRNQPFHYWELHHYFSQRERNVLEIKSMYASKNWPAHRTWGASAMLPWDQENLWRHKEGAPSDPIQLGTDWLALQRPGVSPDRALRGDRYLYSRYPAKNWEPTSVGRTFLRYNMPLLGYLGGKAGDFTEQGHNFLPGERVEKQVIVVNDTREAVRCSYRWSAAFGVQGEGRMAVGPGDVGKEPIAFVVPDGTPPGTYRLSLSVSFEGGQSQDDAMDIHVLAPPGRQPVKGRIALYDPAGKTAKELAALGIQAQPVGADASLAGYDLLIVGREALTVAGPAPDIRRVAQGLNVLVFEQTEHVLHRRLGFRTQVYGLRRVFPRAAGHPILAGLKAENLCDWRGDATLYPPYMRDPGDQTNYPQTEWAGFVNTRVWRCGTEGNVATALIEKPARGDFLPVVDGGFDLQYAPILEWRTGKGRVVFCQMDVTARTDAEPAAARLVRNLVEYCSRPASAEARTTYYAGAPEGKATLRTLGVAARDYTGQRLGARDVLVLGPGAEGPERESLLDAVRGGLNVLLLANTQADLERAPVDVRSELKTVVNSPLHLPVADRAFDGLSNAELHFRDFVELPVLSGVPVADAEGLLAAVGVGRGKVVFCQVAPWMFDPARFNHDRMTYRRTCFLLARVLANLGTAAETPLLTYWHRPAFVAPKLTSGWVGRKDQEDVGLAQGWQKPELDDSDWQPIGVPGAWEQQREDMADYDGVFWYRTRFDFPLLPEGTDLTFVMGAVDDEDWTYLNGRLIGSVTAETNPDDHWAVTRRYRVPAGLLKPSGNVLAVRVNDTHGGGGIVTGPVTFVTSGRWEDSYYAERPEAGDDPYRYYRW